MEKKTWIKAIANAVSMVTIPSGAMTITAIPMGWYGYFLLLLGIGVQVVKYWKEEE